MKCLWPLTPASAADIIRVSANSSTRVMLASGLQGDPRARGYDVRWTQIPHLLLNWNRSTCSHGRCSMLPDGSLEFSRLQTQDSGNYTLEVFDKTGSRLQTKDFLLQVTGEPLDFLSLLLHHILLRGTHCSDWRHRRVVHKVPHFYCHTCTNMYICTCHFTKQYILLESGIFLPCSTSNPTLFIEQIKNSMAVSIREIKGENCKNSTVDQSGFQ